jgi:hypothetical protein
MKKGTIIQVVSDNEDPVKSPNTDMVMAWISIGGKLVQPHGLERVEEDGKAYCTWFIDDTKAIEICGEEINWNEFKKRWHDVEWCKQADFHPIAVMRAFRDNARDGKRQAKEMAVGLRIRKGDRSITVYPHSPQWLKDELARFV